MQVTEPTTLLTDYVLTGLSALLSRRLWSRSLARQNTARKLWSCGLLATAAAAFLGGTSHGFTNYLPTAAQTALWKATVFSIGFAVFFMFTGTVFAAAKPPLKTALIGLAVLKLLAFLLWMSFHDAFKYVIYDYMPTMLAVLVLLIFTWIEGQKKSSLLIAAGIIISFMAAGIQQSGYTLHPHFNHNDLYHVVQMAAIVFMYKGAVLLTDHPDQKGGNRT